MTCPEQFFVNHSLDACDLTGLAYRRKRAPDPHQNQDPEEDVREDPKEYPCQDPGKDPYD